MKKFISFILMVIVTFCVFADVGPTDIVGGKTLNVILDLTGLESFAIAQAGVTVDEPVLSLIDKDYDNHAGINLLLQPENTNSLVLKKNIYVWYYVCALENQCEVIFMPSAFNGNSTYLGYKLTSLVAPTMGSNYEGTVPYFNNHNIGANANYNASEIGKIITSNDAGVSKGYITYEMEVDYTNADPIEYYAPWTIQIRVI